MAELSNQTIKQKVLVLNYDNLRHDREGMWSSMFPNEEGKRKPERICPRWSNGLLSSPPNLAVALTEMLGLTKAIITVLQNLLLVGCI